MKQKICKNCVMDTTDPGIKFNQQGVCDHCTTFKTKILPHWDTGNKGHDKLKKASF